MTGAIGNPRKKPGRNKDDVDPLEINQAIATTLIGRERCLNQAKVNTYGGGETTAVAVELSQGETGDRETG
jgi:hypothetical protein